MLMFVLPGQYSNYYYTNEESLLRYLQFQNSKQQGPVEASI